MGQTKISAPGRYSGYSNVTYAEHIRTSVYVPGWDSTRLALDLYRPAKDGRAVDERFPGILMNYQGPRRAAALLETFQVTDLVHRGYVIAVMERRGSGVSFEAAKGFVTRDDWKDAAAVIEWIAAQPWSTGKIGMMGSSNGGLIQMGVAAMKPPHLVAIVPGVANPNFYYQQYLNGASATGTRGVPSGPPRSQYNVDPANAPVDDDAAPDYPLSKQAIAEHRANITMAQEYPPNLFRDSYVPIVGYKPGLIDSPISYAEEIKASRVKIYQQAGWFDSSAGGQLVAWKLWGGKIIIGAWPHSLERGSKNSILATERLRWFDCYLKGIDNHVADEPPIYYETINAPQGSDWSFSTDWPLANQVPTNYYLVAGQANTVASVNDGRLSAVSRQTETGADSYTVDYSLAAFDRKFVRLARTWNGDMSTGFDRKALTYTTEPLAADLQITGHPVADLWVTSTAIDGNFLLYVEEVLPNGLSHFVTDGAIRASHRLVEPRSPWKQMSIPFHRSFEADFAPLIPNQPAELVFDINPISYIFRRGNRVRVTIAGAERAYDLSKDETLDKPPTIQILRDSAHPSHLVLPVVPHAVPSS